MLELGQQVIDKISANATQVENNRYFKNIKFIKQTSSQNIFNYEVTNIFILKWVQNKYKKEIEAELEKRTNTKIKVIIYVENEAHQTFPIKQEIKTNDTQSSIINPSFTFDSFVVGHSNEFAFASAKKIIEKPGVLYNPLFLYGGVGLGKTHLLQAIGNATINSGYKILYLTTEQLMNDFTKNIAKHTMNQFKDKYRNCDILLIDDIQFLANKEIFQEEFFHTFNELHSNNKQIVLTSDKKPSEIKNLQERLQSRFEWGLLTNIQPPDIETKVGIIKKKCELDSISLTNDIVLYIATHLETNIREIEGILIKINAYAQLVNTEKITIEFVRNILKDHIKEKKENVGIEDILKIVSKELNIKPSEIKSKKRNRTITHARRIVIYLAREMTHSSMPYLAKYFNMKDHSAISHNVKTMKENIKNNKNENIIISEIINKINTREI